MEQSDCELTRGDLVRLWHEVDVDWTDVAFALLVDRDHRDDDLLERGASVDVSSASAGLGNAVDGLWDLMSRSPTSPAWAEVNVMKEGDGFSERPRT